MRRLIVACAMLSVAVGGACAQATPPVETFRGSPITNAYGAGVMTSAGGSRATGEVLRIVGTNVTVAPFLRRRLFEGRYGFALRVGPPVFRSRICRWPTDHPAGLRNCFARERPRVRQGNMEFVRFDDRDPAFEWRVYRTRTVPLVLARCPVRRAGAIVLTCTLFFEQGRLWHQLETSPIALDDMHLYRCAALDLRNAIWPAGLRSIDACQR